MLVFHSDYRLSVLSCRLSSLDCARDDRFYILTLVWQKCIQKKRCAILSYKLVWLFGYLLIWKNKTLNLALQISDNRINKSTDKQISWKHL